MKPILKKLGLWLLVPTVFWALVFGPSVDWYMHKIRDNQVGGWVSSKVLGTCTNIRLSMELAAIQWDATFVQQQLVELDSFDAALDDPKFAGTWPEAERLEMVRSIDQQRERLENYQACLRPRVDSAIVALDGRNARDSIQETRRVRNFMSEKFALLGLRYGLTANRVGSLENSRPADQSISEVVNQALEAIQNLSISSLPVCSVQLQATLKKSSGLPARLREKMPLAGSELTSSPLSSDIVEVCAGSRPLMLLQLTDSGWILTKLYGLGEDS
jgi:hypothetical protein